MAARICGGLVTHCAKITRIGKSLTTDPLYFLLQHNKLEVFIMLKKVFYSAVAAMIVSSAAAAADGVMATTPDPVAPSLIYGHRTGSEPHRMPVPQAHVMSSMAPDPAEPALLYEAKRVDAPHVMPGDQRHVVASRPDPAEPPLLYGFR